MNSNSNIAHPPPGAGSSHDPARQIMEAAAVADKIPGMSVAIASPDRLLYAGAVGYADLEDRRASTVDDQYPWFSMTKIATATTAIRLHAEGVLDIDAPIGTYLPQYRAHATHGHPTTRELLSHTAGLGNPLPVRWGPTRRPAARPGSPRRDHHQARHPQACRRARASYSNIGYLLAGEAIASATGATIEACVRDRVLDPLGMEKTGYDYPPVLRVPSGMCAPHALQSRSFGLCCPAGSWVLGSRDTPP